MTMNRSLPPLRADHLTRRLTGPHGLYEHALFDRPRRRLGYTTDDNARALVVLSSGFPEVDIGLYLDYVVRGRVPGGWHNRMTRLGRWADVRGSDDAHGRAIWGLGCALHGPRADKARPSLISGLDLDSRHARANAYAILGATAALETDRDLPGVQGFLRRAGSRLPRATANGWGWPEPRLSYDNARIPQALIAAGLGLGDHSMIDDGLRFLDWLIHAEEAGAGFSFTPVAGRKPGWHGPGFDQQPIEAWGMADACLLAIAVDGDSRWARALEAAALWVLGRNDVGAALYDVNTGAGFDGLEPNGVNQNRGAESTLATLGALVALRTHLGSGVR
jgi:hypothetical protein